MNSNSPFESDYRELRDDIDETSSTTSVGSFEVISAPSYNGTEREGINLEEQYYHPTVPRFSWKAARRKRKSGFLGSHAKTNKTDHGFESFAYNNFESQVRHDYIRHKSRAQETTENFTRWALTIAVGVSVALIGCFLWWTTRMIVQAKTTLIQGILTDKTLTYAAILFWLINLSLVLLASVLVAYMEPAAGGSGIPEVRCTLNGLRIPNIVRIKTLFVKVLGGACAVGAQLPIGRAGTMIHSGSICGAGISQGKSVTLGFDTSFSKFIQFRSDHEKRDFIACGAAAGIACAFGAPIGGVLFSLEQASSFWNQNLTWRTFVCAIISAFVFGSFSSLVRNNNEPFGYLSGMVYFGDYLEGAPTVAFSSTYAIFNILIFITMGVMGGIIGAIYNAISLRICLFRRRFIRKPLLKVLEAAAVVSIISLLSFVVAAHLGDCVRLDSNHCPTTEAVGAGGQESPDITEICDNTVRFICDKEHYNPLATLLLSGSGTAIRLLFHSDHNWDWNNLLVFFLFYYSISCWTYGISVPSGLFVPHMLAGAAFGRLWGELGRTVPILSAVNPGTYALIGTAALLSGMTRMTISLTIILIESTGDVVYALPLMVTVMSAKWTGDLFNGGLYDNVIYLIKRYPFLGHKPGRTTRGLYVEEVMATPVKCIGEVCRVQEIYELLTSCSHNGFPVEGKDGKLKGLIMRHHLTTILDRGAFYKSKPSRESDLSDLEYSPLTYLDFESQFPRYPSIENINLESTQMRCYVVLTRFMDMTPYNVKVTTPVDQAFRLFRSMGLRHLIVVDDVNAVVGMITRAELANTTMSDKLGMIFSHIKESVYNGY